MKAWRLVLSCHAFVIQNEPSWARTSDPQIKSLLLYQLSYRPVKRMKNYTLLACGVK